LESAATGELGRHEVSDPLTSAQRIAR